MGLVAGGPLFLASSPESTPHPQTAERNPFRLRGASFGSLCRVAPSGKARTQGAETEAGQAPHCLAQLPALTWVLPHVIRLLLLNWNVSKMELKLLPVMDFPSRRRRILAITTPTSTLNHPGLDKPQKQSHT